MSKRIRQKHDIRSLLAQNVFCVKKGQMRLRYWPSDIANLAKARSESIPQSFRLPFRKFQVDNVVKVTNTLPIIALVEMIEGLVVLSLIVLLG